MAKNFVDNTICHVLGLDLKRGKAIDLENMRAQEASKLIQKVKSALEFDNVDQNVQNALEKDLKHLKDTNDEWIGDGEKIHDAITSGVMKTLAMLKRFAQDDGKNFSYLVRACELDKKVSELFYAEIDATERFSDEKPITEFIEIMSNISVDEKNITKDKSGKKDKFNNDIEVIDIGDYKGIATDSVKKLFISSYGHNLYTNDITLLRGYNDLTLRNCTTIAKNPLSKFRQLSNYLQAIGRVRAINRNKIYNLFDVYDGKTIEESLELQRKTYKTPEERLQAMLLEQAQSSEKRIQNLNVSITDEILKNMRDTRLTDQERDRMESKVFISVGDKLQKNLLKSFEEIYIYNQYDIKKTKVEFQKVCKGIAEEFHNASNTEGSNAISAKNKNFYCGIASFVVTLVEFISRSFLFSIAQGRGDYQKDKELFEKRKFQAADKTSNLVQRFGAFLSVTRYKILYASEIFNQYRQSLVRMEVEANVNAEYNKSLSDLSEEFGQDYEKFLSIKDDSAKKPEEKDAAIKIFQKDKKILLEKENNDLTVKLDSAIKKLDAAKNNLNKITSSRNLLSKDVSAALNAIDRNKESLRGENKAQFASELKSAEEAVDKQRSSKSNRLDYNTKLAQDKVLHCEREVSNIKARRIAANLKYDSFAHTTNSLSAFNIFTLDESGQLVDAQTSITESIQDDKERFELVQKAIQKGTIGNRNSAGA